MSFTEAKATGYFADTPASSGCATWTTANYLPIGAVVISHDRGVVAIMPKGGADMRTPEGLRLGLTTAQVHGIYPSFDVADANAEDGGPRIPVPGHPGLSYQVSFGTAGQVVHIELLDDNEDCFD